MIANPKRIKSIKFGIFSPKEIRKMSVTKIITPDTYDDDGFPIEMGLMDQRLGVIDPGLRCKTCGGRPGECPGHFGHIELVAPVIHAGYARLIKKILRSTCVSCNRVLLEKKDRDRFVTQIKRFQQVGQPLEEILKEVFKKAMAVEICPHCGTKQPKITFESPTTYEEDGHKLMPADIRARLEQIPDEDLPVMGMNPKEVRPEWMVLTVLPVPPVTARPSITLESGQRSEDDLTHKLVDIIRINQRFQENREAGAPQLIIEDLWELLQYHVTTYIDNEVSGIPPARHRSGRPLKTLSQRLKGKEGRFRGSLSGKRVNFSARTVISPDPNLSINEVGVPQRIAEEMTITENVTDRNFESMQKLIRRGRRYPAANYVKRLDGKRVKVTEANYEELADQMQVGWKVERQLRDGDIVLFNRQPSLHRMSIMAHRVKVMPGKTFRLNPAVCPPYNADFDGDEMNLHVLQNEEARAEARILMDVEMNILSPRFGGPVIGGIHDHISGLYLLTRGDMRFDENDALELLRRSRITDLIEPSAGEGNNKPYWSGKDIFSMILPEGLNLRFEAEICQNCDTCLKEQCEHDAYVVIENGRLITGTIDEKAIGAFKGKILDRITKEYGYDRARKFIDEATSLAIRAITRLGFSFGIDDEDIPPDAQRQIQASIIATEERVAQLVDAYDNNELEPLPGRSIEETLELRIMQELGRVRDAAGEIAGKYLGMDNTAVAMAVSGARGSMMNLTQMAGCVGQQSVRGARITRGFDKRTLPHFRRGDLGAAAHGFVKSSYKEGLSPTEFFFHAIGGREGLVDTAVRTSQSGYFQRRLINALQDIEVKYDRTVRETRGMIVQFEYGEDGVDPSRGDYGKSVNIDRIIELVTGVGE
ncbi:MAG: DNA-directed RNA polymerase subunit A' [Candidatus Syntrophoarchaeum caldarius]|uniref:DNA-directed RNA polymerase subunit Rpo1N n=1 Tax=Candidatus Syntropharchaeum caldarium TaxID=1838285 RepID=A0A1F2P9F9_9EURY|nr:MAG: DNA-directed RNA polymerase subunit A' [Candidatus Syntrophoarchaeum caldarius]